MKFDLFLSRFREVLEQKISAVRGKPRQAFIQTLAGKTLLFGRVRGDRHLVNVQVGSLFPQRFTKDVFRDAITVSHLVFDLLGGDFQDHAVDGFIREFIGKVAAAQREEPAQAKAQAFVLFTCTLEIRVEPFEKTRKLFRRYLWFQGCIRPKVEVRIDREFGG